MHRSTPAPDAGYVVAATHSLPGASGKGLPGLHRQREPNPCSNRLTEKECDGGARNQGQDHPRECGYVMRCNGLPIDRESSHGTAYRHVQYPSSIEPLLFVP